MKYEEKATIQSLRREGEYLLLSLFSPLIAREARPGQFVNVRVSDTLDPLLRRPLSIADVVGEEVRLLVQIRGKGTRLLAEKMAGDTLSLVGPLGNGFPVVEKEVIFVAGGVGVAPFAWLMRLFPSARLLVGFRSREMIPPLDWFDEKRVMIATDDGSVGKKGTVLDLLQQEVLKDKVVFACGPHRMLAALSDFLEKNSPDIEAYFSTESMMACGFGACKGCVLPKRDGEYALCCSDGPVFAWREMVWESR